MAKKEKQNSKSITQSKKTKNEEMDSFFGGKKEAVKKSDLKAELVNNQKNKLKINPKIILLAGGVLLVAGLLGTSGYFYYQYRKAARNPNILAQDEIKSLVEKIGKFIDLPDEAPALATVADAEKLKGQAFFANAQNGDKVLIYSKSSKAILYRPTTGKIIEITSLQAPLNALDNQQTSQAPAQTQANSQTNSEIAAQNQSSNQPVSTEVQSNQTPAPETPKTADVVIYNGTNQKGLAKSIAGELADVSGVNIVSTGNAKGNYTKTIIVDLSGGNTEIAQKIANTVGGEIGSLPPNETKPEADILVIGGAE